MMFVQVPASTLEKDRKNHKTNINSNHNSKTEDCTHINETYT